MLTRPQGLRATPGMDPSGAKVECGPPPQWHLVSLASSLNGMGDETFRCRQCQRELPYANDTYNPETGRPAVPAGVVRGHLCRRPGAHVKGAPMWGGRTPRSRPVGPSGPLDPPRRRGHPSAQSVLAKLDSWHPPWKPQAAFSVAHRGALRRILRGRAAFLGGDSVRTIMPGSRVRARPCYDHPNHLQARSQVDSQRWHPRWRPGGAVSLAPHAGDVESTGRDAGGAPARIPV